MPLDGSNAFIPVRVAIKKHLRVPEFFITLRLALMQ
jgi:hypothetical protein